MTRRYTGGLISATAQATDANSANGIFTLADAQERTARGNFPTGRWTPQKSLRFRNSANTFLRRLPTTTGNRKIFTHSVWFKLGLISTTLIIFEASDATGTTVRSPFRMTSEGYLQWTDSASGATVNTTSVLKDPSAWYHAVVAVDTTQTITTERVKMYINGVRVTSFSTYTAPTLNSDTLFNTAAYYNTIGSGTYWVSQAFDGYMAEFNHIDGQALSASSFGLTDSETGSWIPKRYTGTYGTNGFYLSFNPDYDTSTKTVNPDFTADYVVVAGGGGGGNGAGSPGTGGGAGGYRTSAGTSGGNSLAESSIGLKLSTAYNIILGAGGAGGSGAGASKGSDSKFFNIISFGGGGGQSPGIGDGWTSSGIGQGGSGSGGDTIAGGSGTLGQGSNGGLSFTGSGGLSSGNGFNSGGGGGAGAVGTNANGSVAGAGGNGLATTISGSSVTYGGGGAGGNDSARVNGPASGGTGGGGSSVYGSAGTNATVNTGGGGGAGSNRANAGGAGFAGGNGGSGIIIIKIPNTRTATFSAGVTSSLNSGVAGFKIYTVTATSSTSETVTFS